MADRKKQTAEIINPGLGDIEKVRDILFGKHVASIQNQFADLEQRMVNEVEHLRKRLQDKMSEMDVLLNKSVERLNKQISAEEKSRASALGSLESMLQEAQTRLEGSISLMEDQAEQDLSAIKAQLSESREELLEHIKTQQGQLEKDKVGRQALALMLDEVAVKLRSS